jgi:5-(carboxyamino)imidazole ribonucleotide synthase
MTDFDSERFFALPDAAGSVGILGAGQLGRMLAAAAAPLGLNVFTVDPKDAPSAARHAGHFSAAFDSPEALRQLSERVDVVTYEFENIPVGALEQLLDVVDVYPGVRALEVSGDRGAEKEFFESLGIEVAPWRGVDSRSELDAAADALGFPLILKTRQMGYDGKGQAWCDDPSDLDDAWEQIGEWSLVAEGFVDFQRELSIIGARRPCGETAMFPLAENLHKDGILIESEAPAEASDETVERAHAICRKALDGLDYVGVLSIELFQDPDGTLRVNEMAPRVHNSGHWTIEGSETSQFEQHIRSVAGFSLGDTASVAPTHMLNTIGGLPDRRAVLEVPGAHLHDYQKEARPGRKIGHITVRAGDRDALTERVERIRPLVEDARDLG